MKNLKMNNPLLLQFTFKKMEEGILLCKNKNKMDKLALEDKVKE